MSRPNELVPTLNNEVVLGIHWQRGLMEVNKQQLRSIQPEVHKEGRKAILYRYTPDTDERTEYNDNDRNCGWVVGRSRSQFQLNKPHTHTVTSLTA